MLFQKSMHQDNKSVLHARRKASQNIRGATPYNPGKDLVNLDINMKHIFSNQEGIENFEGIFFFVKEKELQEEF